MTDTTRPRRSRERGSAEPARHLPLIRVITLCVLAVAVSASASQTHTERIRFDGLRCGQDRMQAFVRALAAAQELGYETRDVDADEGTFKGRLKQPNHHLRLVVKVTCSGARSGGHDAFKAFFGPPRVEVEAIFTARTGGRAAARTEGNRFRAKLDVLMDAYLPVPSCLGFTIGEVRSLDRETRARLKVDTGMVVQKVAAGGPATAAGLQPWDVLLGVDGVETPTFARLRGLLRRKKPGDTVTLLVSRAGRTVQPEVVLGRRGDDGSCAAVGAAASDRLPAPPQPVRDYLELGDVVVKPQPVSPGEPFDVELTVDLV